MNAFNEEGGAESAFLAPRRKGVSTKQELTEIAQASRIKITGAYVISKAWQNYILHQTSGKLPEEILRQRTVDRRIVLPDYLTASTGSKKRLPATPFKKEEKL